MNSNQKSSLRVSNQAAVVTRKLHKGLVGIPYPDLPLPKRFQTKTVKANDQPAPQVQEVEPPPQPEAKLEVKPKIIPDGHHVEEVAYEHPTLHIDNEQRVKDMKSHVIEDLDYNEYAS